MQLLRQSFASVSCLLRLGIVLPLAIGISGCKREQIRVYSVPKERPVEVASSRAAGVAPHLHYKAPEGWTEHEASGMRLLRMTAPDKTGRDMEISAIMFPSSTPSVEVLNIVRRDNGLAPLKPEEVSGALENVTIGKFSGEMFDMLSAKAVGETNQKARIVVAMLKQADATWFFRMAGEDESVRNEKPKFQEFLKSVEFDTSDHGTSSARFTSTNVKEIPRKGSDTGGTPEKPVWAIPPAWKEAPPSQMLLAKFLVPGEGASKAEVTVSVFPEDAGGVLANVNRWRGQLGLGSVSAAELQSITRPLEVPGAKAILVDMSGTDVKTGQKARLIAAILPQGARTWFYKLMGDEEITERERETFVKFVQTAKHPNG